MQGPAVNVRFDAHLEARFQKKIKAETRHSFLISFKLAICLFPLFSIVDYFVYPDHLMHLNIIRAATIVMLIGIYLWMSGKKFQGNIYTAGVMMLSAMNLGIVAMVIDLGGYSSRYYAGVNLVILGGSVLFPWGASQIFALSFLQFLLYFVSVGLWYGFVIDDVPRFVNNISFILSTCMIGSAGAYLSDRLRRQAYARRILAEEARDRIVKAVNIISQELHPQNAPLSEEQAVEQVISLSKELAEARTKAETALKIRDEFISTASHELKTPLTVIRLQNGYLQKIMKEGSHPANPDMPSKIRSMLTTNELQIRRLVRLIEDMLDLTRIETGKLRVVKESVDLKQICQGVITLMAPQLERAGITVSLSADAGVIGYWDGLRLEQMITNFLDNAIKYAPHAPLEVRVSGDDHLARISVQDHGPGIPAENRERIFDLYERASPDAGISGLGLGLYLCRSIVELHQGRIWVESEQGNGARFHVELPTEN